MPAINEPIRADGAVCAWWDCRVENVQEEKIKKKKIKYLSSEVLSSSSYLMLPLSLCYREASLSMKSTYIYIIRTGERRECATMHIHEKYNDKYIIMYVHRGGRERERAAI